MPMSPAEVAARATTFQITEGRPCTDRDELSTWDAGDLKGNHVAMACS
ncbi:hypothetical protein ABZ016_13615 [Streptomyces sp. NPDC006372]